MMKGRRIESETPKEITLKTNFFIFFLLLFWVCPFLIHRQSAKQYLPRPKILSKAQDIN